jgi:hypothetical protein
VSQPSKVPESSPGIPLFFLLPILCITFAPLGLIEYSSFSVLIIADGRLFCPPELEEEIDNLGASDGD